jgi:hypothetical protein
MTWWQWVLIVVAVLIVIALLAGVKDIQRYLRMRRM